MYFEKKFFGLWAKKYEAGFSKSHSTCPWEHFEEISFLKKWWFPSIFRNLSGNFSYFEQKILGLPAKKLRHGFQKRILRVQLIILKKWKILKKWWFPWNFCALGEKISYFEPNISGFLAKSLRHGFQNL